MIYFLEGWLPIDGLKHRYPKKDREVFDIPPETFGWQEAIPETHQHKLKRSFSYYLGHVFLFVLVSLATVFGIAAGLDYKSKLSSQATNIQLNLGQGLKAFDENNYSLAVQKFNQADGDIKELKINLQESGQMIPYLFYLPNSGSKLVESSRILDVVSKITPAVKIISDVQTQFATNKTASTDQLATISSATSGLSSLAQTDSNKINNCLTNLDQAQNLLQSSSSGNYSSERQAMLNKIPKLQTMLKSVQGLYNIAPGFLAADGSKKYLIFFQNNAELRPAGGFWGSYAVAGFDHGNLKSLDFQTNIYKLDQAFEAKAGKQAAPAVYPPYYENITLRDSNQFNDFKESATSALSYYQKESGSSADGVIGLDTTLITNLLKIIGPIEMPAYNTTITDKNFMDVVEYQVEIGYFKDKNNWSENEPKKMLADMMPIFISKVFTALKSGDNQAKVISLLSDSLSEKHLLFYSNDQNAQNYFENKNIAGRLTQTKGDYFMMTNTNVNGGKSSLNISETVSQKIEIDTVGRATKTIDIKRHHNGDGQWPDSTNITYDKILIPKGSVIKDYQLVSGSNLYDNKSQVANGPYKVTEENGYTVVGFWQNTTPGGYSETKLTYLLPEWLDFSSNYQLLMQKQPGTLSAKYQIEISKAGSDIYLDAKLLKTPVNFVFNQDMIFEVNLK